MKKVFFVILVIIYPALTPSLVKAEASAIIGPGIEIIDNNIIVSAGIDNVRKLESTIKSGIGKEIIFTIELMRVWRFWPDEFIVSKKIKKFIRYDNLREQYFTFSHDGTTLIEKHFDDFNIIKPWIFAVEAVNITNIRELEDGDYYIRVIVESKSREQLPVIGFLMHFIPEREMSVIKESPAFPIMKQ